MNATSILSIVNVNGQSEVRPSCPVIEGIVDLSAQSASISATNLVAVTSGKMYRITGNLATTSGQSGTGDVEVTISYTGPNGASTINTPAQLTLAAGNTQPASPVLIRTTVGSQITWSTTYNATGKYDVLLIAELVVR